MAFQGRRDVVAGHRLLVVAGRIALQVGTVARLVEVQKPEAPAASRLGRMGGGCCASSVDQGAGLLDCIPPPKGRIYAGDYAFTAAPARYLSVTCAQRRTAPMGCSGWDNEAVDLRPGDVVVVVDGKEIEAGEEGFIRVICSKVRVLPSATLDPSISRVIAELSQTGNGSVIRLHDKLAALDRLARALGMYQKIDDVGPKNQITVAVTSNEDPPATRRGAPPCGGRWRRRPVTSSLRRRR
jgi:hypothetical protein